MNFTASDFSEMKYAVYSTPDSKLFASIPILKDIYTDSLEYVSQSKSPESLEKAMAWQNYMTPEQLMKYIVYVYHRKSPLAERIAHIVTRKKTALELVGLNLPKLDKSEDAKPVIQSMIISHHELCNHLALNFLKFENNIKWMQLVRAMEAWEDALFQMQQESEGTKSKSAVDIAAVKTKLYQGAKQYQDDINRLAAELMQEDISLSNVISGHLFIEKNRKRLIVPEDYASLTPEERDEEFASLGLRK